MAEERATTKAEPETDAVRSADPSLVFGEKLISSRLLRELRAAGYDAHRSAVYRVLAKLKAETPSSKVTERFEAPTGQQVQFDWSPYTIEFGGEQMRLIVFGIVLGDSRRKDYTASLDETQASIY